MKIYTKTGDDGTTGLIGGFRVDKSDLRIECYGTVDELNATIGWAGVGQKDDAFGRALRAVQNELFVIGSLLASPAEDSSASRNLPQLAESSVTRLEQQIDAADAELPRLANFILPGGTESAARLHIARTICRRAERLVVSLAKDQSVAALLVTYLNRLSDWLFVQARLANHRAGIADVAWEK
ncbi:MAG: cob(I)yrinic acid a,c-diamide adenosyltransferase [Vicinamibacterales bacterium]